MDDEPTEAIDASDWFFARSRETDSSFSDYDRTTGSDTAVLLATRENVEGALAPYYDVPSAQLVRRDRIGMSLTISLLAIMVVRFVFFVQGYRAYWPLEMIWIVPLASMNVQWFMAYRDRPVRKADARLARLHVTVAIPCWNEDPVLLDRAIWAMANSSRPPQRIDIVDDGSTKVDYTVVREHWLSVICGIDIRWHYQNNAGKKAAQGVVFGDAPETDVFIIIDSDTAVDHDAMRRVLLPFADRSVASVAGIELAANGAKNWLTRTVSVRSMFFQFLPCAAQSALGDVLINRGAFFAIRAQVVRDHLDAYLNETFCGRRIRLGDDAALTLFARSSGKTVQQSDAFAFTMYPEKLSHHLRQWIRWMRGSSIRTCWRLRYLSPRTFGWWFSLLGVYSFIVSTLFPILLIVMLPETKRACEYVLLVTLGWGYVYGLRYFSVRRSDESRWFQLASYLMYPTVLLWGLLVLRVFRLYGTATFLKQGWTTRQNGVEVTLNDELAVEGSVA